MNKYNKKLLKIKRIMKNKFFWFAGVIIVAVLVALIIFAVKQNKQLAGQKTFVNSIGNKIQTKNNAGQGGTEVIEKKGIKRFTLKAVGGVSTSGDGSITLKTDLTSMAVRLVDAPDLGQDQKYEVYVQLTDGNPVFAGEMFA